MWRGRGRNLLSLDVAVEKSGGGESNRRPFCLKKGKRKEALPLAKKINLKDVSI